MKTLYDMVDALERRGIYIWLKPILTGPQALWCSHVLTVDRHINVGNYPDKDMALTRAIDYAAEHILTKGNNKEKKLKN